MTKLDTIRKEADKKGIDRAEVEDGHYFDLYFEVFLMIYHNNMGSDIEATTIKDIFNFLSDAINARAH